MSTDAPVSPAKLIPALSTCMYCQCGQHGQCVPNQKDQLGRIKVLCECAVDAHHGQWPCL